MIGGFLYASLKNVRHAKLPRDLAETARLALITLRRRARNYFQFSDASQAGQNLLLNPICEIGAIRIGAQVLEWQHCNAFLWRRRQNPGEFTSEDPHGKSSKEKAGGTCRYQFWI